MSDPIVAALIGALGTVVAALIGKFASVSAKDRASSKYRRSLGLPEVLGRWKCDWFNEDGSLYVADEVTIEKWVKDGRFMGRGVQPNLSYEIEGEIDSTRVMALTYRTIDFPTKAYVGVACLEFNIDGNGLVGHWYGRARSGDFMGGVVKWSKIQTWTSG